MKISENGIRFIKNWEGFRALAYIDTVGRYTVGYGRLLTTTQSIEYYKHHTFSEPEADKWLRDFIKNIENKINVLVKVPLTQGQFDALCSFCYNLGWHSLEESTLLKLLNEKKYGDAAEQFLRWNKGRVNGKLVAIAGLTRRRKAERKLFLTGEI